MSFTPFAAIGEDIVSALPPLATQAGNGVGWLDIGVVPNVRRAFDGVSSHLFQPGGIAPRTGVTGLTLTAAGLLLHDTFTGLVNGQSVVGHAPDIGPAGAYTAGADGVFGALGAHDVTMLSHTGAGHDGLFKGATVNVGQAGDFVVIVKMAATGALSGASRFIALQLRFQDENNFLYWFLWNNSGDIYSRLNQRVAGADSTLLTVGASGAPAWGAGDQLSITGAGAAVTMQTNAGIITANATGPTNASGLYLDGNGVDITDGPALSELVLTKKRTLVIQGVRPGWAAKVFAADGVTLIASGVEAGAGTISCDIAASCPIAGITGSIQLYTDNTYATPVANGRFPQVGNAAGIYPGDLYQWSF